MIGDKIRMYRESKGITQEELATAANISVTAIQSYEENKWKPGMTTVSQIADALQVPIVDLFEGCKALYDDSGDILLVEENCNRHIKVLGRIVHKERACPI